MAGRLVAALAAPAAGLPTAASAADVPGSTRSSRRPVGATPLRVSTRTSTPSECATTSGSVPARSCAASAVPGSGACSADSCDRGDQAVQPPPARVRTQAASEPAGTVPSQVTPTTEKPDVARRPLETAGRRPAAAVPATRGSARVAAGRSGTRAPRATAIGPAVRLTVCTEVRTGWGAAAAGASSGTAPLPSAVSVTVSAEVDRSRRRRRPDGMRVRGTKDPPVNRTKRASSP